MRTLMSTVALALCLVSPAAHAQRLAPVAVLPAAPIDTMSFASTTPARLGIAYAGRGMPSWVKWGLVGAAAGAVTFPLLGSLASDSQSNAAGQAVAGAVSGFVIVGGGVALWQAVCGPDSSSRRAGLCGR